MDAICDFPTIEVGQCHTLVLVIARLPCERPCLVQRMHRVCALLMQHACWPQLGNLNELLGHLLMERASSAPPGLQARARKQVCDESHLLHACLGTVCSVLFRSVIRAVLRGCCAQAREARQRALAAFQICLGMAHEKYIDLAARLRMMR